MDLSEKGNGIYFSCVLRVGMDRNRRDQTDQTVGGREYGEREHELGVVGGGALEI